MISASETHVSSRPLPGTAALAPSLLPAAALPVDADRALLVGRTFVPGRGPVPVRVTTTEVLDLSALAPTMSRLLDLDSPARAIRDHRAPPLIASAATNARDPTSTAALLANTPPDARDPTRPWLLAPCDLQAVKAAGVTFVSSMLERVIEEQTRGDPARAASVRAEVVAVIGDELSRVKPGSSESAELKRVLVARGLWSQYLEVGLGPDAEIFTKAQPMSAVGTGAHVGLHPASRWNNPEPEVVLAVSSRGEVVGCTLGNDVNLRDFEGRSALLLGKAKDNNASCAIGPFIRLLDGDFSIDDLRRLELTLEVHGAADGFRLEGSSSLALISRDPLDLAAQAMAGTHQYPDGFMLFLGTMFAPTKDRHGPGEGFTHDEGDLVTICTPRLGTLANVVTTSDRAPPWTYGVGDLIDDLIVAAARPRQ